MKTTYLKKKLTMTACTVTANGSITEHKDRKFEAMLNPSSFNHKHKICYSEKKKFGQIGSDSKFDAMLPDTVSFELLLDGTGVARTPVPGLRGADVKTQVEELNRVFEYDGETHEPNHVKILWGALLFYGRLQSMSIDYTLFKLSGEPLRAKVKLVFQGFITKKEEQLIKNQSSPDLTHRIEFRDGDSLPLLCHRVYEDCSYYLEVARVNDISSINDIRPGTWLVFPPLR